MEILLVVAVAAVTASPISEPMDNVSIPSSEQLVLEQYGVGLNDLLLEPIKEQPKTEVIQEPINGTPILPVAKTWKEKHPRLHAGYAVVLKTAAETLRILFCLTH